MQLRTHNQEVHRLTYILPRSSLCLQIKFPDSDVMHDIVVHGDLAAVNALLDKGVDPNIPDPDGLTALHRACTENYLNIASALVAKGADIKAQDNDWWTPLHAAANSGEPRPPDPPTPVCDETGFYTANKVLLNYLLTIKRSHQAARHGHPLSLPLSGRS